MHSPNAGTTRAGRARRTIPVRNVTLQRDGSRNHIRLRYAAVGKCPAAAYDRTSAAGCRVMIFVLDNYDSFTYNLVQRLGEIDRTLIIEVARNDDVTVA